MPCGRIAPDPKIRYTYSYARMHGWSRCFRTVPDAVRRGIAVSVTRSWGVLLVFWRGVGFRQGSGTTCRGWGHLRRANVAYRRRRWLLGVRCPGEEVGHVV